MKTAYKPVVKLAAAAAAAFFAVSSIQVPVTALAYTKPAGSHVLTPIASGVTTYSNEKATLDASNVSEGYIMVKYTGSVGKIKVQITKSGSETYTYDLSSSGVYEVFPLSEGSGSYSVKVFENIQGNQYSQAFSQNVNATITNQFGPFLYPCLLYTSTMPIIQGMMIAPLLAAGSMIPMLAALVIRPALATAVGFMPAMANAKANSSRMAAVWVPAIIRPR